jgi:hypothetical protein
MRNQAAGRSKPKLEKLLDRPESDSLSLDFKSGLVPQDPNVRRASAFSEHFRSQCAAAGPAQNNGRKKRHPKRPSLPDLFDQNNMESSKDDDGPSTYLSFYTAPRGAIPKGWRATPHSLGTLRPKLQLIDGVSLNGKSNDDELKMLRGTPLKHLIPAPPEAGGMSAVWLGRKAAADMSGELHAGPWAWACPGLIDLLSQYLREALEDENPTLLVVRE